MPTIDQMAQQAVWMFFGAIIFIVFLMGFMLFFGWWVSQKRGSMSPYSGKPMMFGVDVPHSIIKKVNDFIKTFPSEDNPEIDFRFVAVCRETKRIFPHAMKRGIIRLHSHFLDERCKGQWVSWGGLTDMQKAIFKLQHISLEGFQTEESCPNKLPEQIDGYHAMLRPGPLYVDVATKVVLGWRRVPDTAFEVLIVKRPEYDSIDETL